MAAVLNSGIYEIVNLVNGKRYVGSAKKLDRRIYEHRLLLASGRHHNKYLQASWSKYGPIAFRFNVLIVCRECDLLLFEQAIIDGLEPEFNFCRVAGSTLGVSHSDVTKAKIAARALGRKRDPDSVERGAAKLRGVKRDPKKTAYLIGNQFAVGLKHTEEWKKRNSAMHTGVSRPKSEEHKKKISQTLSKISKSPEIRARLREQAAQAWESRSLEDRLSHMEKVRAARGPITEEQRRNISRRQVGKPMHPNAASALLAANKGRKLSEEHRLKISANSLKSWTPERKAKQASAMRAYHSQKKN